MTQERPANERKRRNIMMQESVYRIARGLMRDRHMGGNKFSQLLSDLVLDAHSRQSSGEQKARGQTEEELMAIKQSLANLEERLGQLEGARRDQPTPKPGARVDALSGELMMQFKEYMAACLRDNPQDKDKSAMFESWALQKLAGLLAAVLDLEARLREIDRHARRR